MSRRSRHQSAGVWIVALALLRSLRRRRMRVAAAFAAGVCGLALTTAVFVISWSVLDAIRDVKISSLDHADWAAVARSSSGMDASVAQRIRRAVRGAHVAPVILANTRLVDGGTEPFLLVGATTELERLLAPREQRQMRRLPVLRGDALYLTQEAAKDRHIRVGDTVALQTPGGVRSWRVTGLIEGSFANRGQVAFATLPTVARAFERPRSIDMLFIGLPTAASDGHARLQRAVAGVATIVRPDHMTDGWAKSFRSLRSLLAVFALLALLTSAGVLYFAWRLTVEEERLNVARLCLVGASKRHLAVAATLIAIPALCICLLVGAPLGLALGASLSGFTDRLVTLAQLAAHPRTPIVKPVLATAAIGGLTLTLAWIGATMALLRVPLIESITARRAAPAPRSVRGAAIATLTAGVASMVLLRIPATHARALAAAGLLLTLLGASMVGPALAGAVLSRLPGWTALAAGREVTHGLRRSSSLVAVFALAVAMAIGLDGAAGSLRRQMDANVRAWTKADIFVDAAPPGENLQDDKFAPWREAAVKRTPGVVASGWFAYSLLDMGPHRVSLWSWGSGDGIRGLQRLVALDVTDGPSGARFWQALERGEIGVSTNFARLNDVGVGDTIVVPGRSRAWRLPIAAVVNDLVSDGGVLFVSPRRYAQLSGDRRRYQFAAALAPGANVRAARAHLQHAFGAAYPDSVVWDQAEIRGHFASLTSGLLQAFGLVARVLFLLALLIGATAITAGVSARRRSLAIAQMVGASRRLVRRQVIVEHLTLGACAWIVGVPVGLALVPAIVNVVAVVAGLLPGIQLGWSSALVTLPLTLALVVMALLLATRRSSTPTNLAGAIADE